MIFKQITSSLLLFTVALMLTVPVLTSAQIGEFTNQAAEQAGYDINGEGTPSENVAAVVGTVARIFLSFLGVIFIIYIIYGGWLWMTASGNEEKLSKAKKVIRDGVIGLIITLSAAGIYVLVISALNFDYGGGGGGGGSTLTT